jgi:hypothetical protein
MTAMVRVAFFSNAARFPVIPNNPTRKKHHPFDQTAYRQRNLIERMFCRLRDWETHRHPLRQTRSQLRRRGHARGSSSSGGPD